VNAKARAQKQDYEPFIFSLIQHYLPLDDQERSEQATISNHLAYGLMAFVTLGILVSWLSCGATPTR
jgi:hypothetical protein